MKEEESVVKSRMSSMLSAIFALQINPRLNASLMQSAMVISPSAMVECNHVTSTSTLKISRIL